MAGRFIVFEGIDGSGKSTALKRVAGRLHEAGHDLVTTREETDSFLGDAVRRSIAERLDPLATLHLFIADRAEHVRSIRDHLADGQHVLCDRFMHSTLAYQGVTLRGRIDDATQHIRRLHEPIQLRPDHVVLFDVDPDISTARIEGRDHKTLYEKAAFLRSVRQAYLDLAAAEPDVFTILDAAMPLDDVIDEAEQIVASWLETAH